MKEDIKERGHDRGKSSTLYRADMPTWAVKKAHYKKLDIAEILLLGLSLSRSSNKLPTLVLLEL